MECDDSSSLSLPKSPTTTDARLAWLYDFDQLQVDTNSSDDEPLIEAAVDKVLTGMLE